jgi:CRISPR-associated protein Csy2
MNALIFLRHIKVENANAIAGVTWGFPAISGFVGFVHALSRKLPFGCGVTLEGCAVICHSSNVQAYKPSPMGDHVFALTRNPLTRSASTPSFVEEGRMAMDISLVIPVFGEFDSEIDLEAALGVVRDFTVSSRVAGGTVVSVREVEIKEPPEDFDELRRFERKQLGQLLPGFALVERSDILAEHSEKLSKDNPDFEPMDAFLDFASLQYKTDLFESGEVEGASAIWSRVDKPSSGWLVPITTGYRSISKLYEPGVVDRTRDCETPFCFAESVYTIGQWLSPHRAEGLSDLFWSYSNSADDGWYLCKNSFRFSE